MKKCRLCHLLCSFTKVKPLLILVCFFVSICRLFGQQNLEGIVFDANTKQRVASVYLYNTKTNEGSFNNLKGEFKLQANPGDLIILAKEGYFPDTITVHHHQAVTVYLQRSSIWLKEVHVMARKSPQKELEEKKEEFESAYRKGDPGSLLSTGMGGVGLSIDALYSLISREGKNARYLQEIIERDYRDAIIDFRFTPHIVKMITGLPDNELKEFMLQYRPSYFFILNSNDYTLGLYIKECFEQYKADPKARKLPPLLPSESSSNDID